MCEKKSLYAIAIMRISIGLMMLWSFLDKLLGWGFATPRGQAWVDGVSPTYYYLAKVAHGPMQGLWQNIAGNVFVDWLFMLGLLGVGLSLTLGVFVRLGSLAGIVMFALFYLTVFPPQFNPLLDEHTVYIFSLIVLLACCNQKVLSMANLLRRKTNTAN